MWTEVYFSQSDQKVTRLVELLHEAEIISRVKRIDAKEGIGSTCYKVLVPQSELEEAQNLMVDRDLF
ncbi:MAG: hypothetical protein IJT23_04900 [Clostridia bacterium]|nr:hypothetical protein [Clostridia bacterium]